MSAQPNMSVPAASSDRPPLAAKDHPLRAISFGNPAVRIDRRDNGTIYLKPKIPLGEFPVRLTDRLHHWARVEPNRIFMAERDANRGWRQITYAQLLASTRSIASALLARGLSADEPIVILSGNSIDHALLAFGALYAGIPFCPVSPAYSLVSKDYGKLAYLMKLLTPGLVFADDAGKFADARGASGPPCGTRGDRSGYHRQIPADLGLDRKPEGCDQHPADDLRQPADAARDAGVPEGRAAGDCRLAAVESHLRRQSQYRTDAVQRRLDVSRRRQADARRHRGDGAQPRRDLADGLFQRAQRLRIAAALSARRQGAAR